MPSFGRITPTDWKHVERYPLTASVTPDKPTPVVLGINWYTAFGSPMLVSGRYWIRETGLGFVEGGHAICVKPGVLTDPVAWWQFYDQGNEGACVGFSESRAMSLMNRTRYGGRWLYKMAQLGDEWPGEDYEGTSVRAGFEVLRTRGHRRLVNGVLGPEKPGDGISAYRWARSVEEVHAAIKMPLADQLGAVPLLNSWGVFYPHIVWLPDSVLERLLNEDGEAGLVTDR
jgi:hypothetical protein